MFAARGAGAELATAHNWQFPPFNRWAFSNVRRLLPTARVRRGLGAAQPFECQPCALGELAVGLPGGERKPLQQLLDDALTDGFLVLHRGRLVYERYGGALRADQTHIVMSVSKSILSGLIGILIERGVLDLARTAGHYVPELHGGGYGCVPLGRLLDMRSGVKYSEDYGDPQAEFFDFDAVCGLRPPARPHPARGMYEYLAMLPADPSDPGDFCYRSTDTDVLGWIAERSAGVPLERLLEAELWAPLGTEEDADLLVDPLGAPLADGGLCTTLRDLGRFAQMQLDQGSFNGRQIVPASWIEASRSGDRAAYARNGLRALFPGGSYSRQWWLADAERRRRLALGIHGQMIYLDTEIELACILLASTAKPVERGGLESKLNACFAIGQALR
jgi:CubicO group peptidase (beta-lactamase class C family)